MEPTDRRKAPTVDLQKMLAGVSRTPGHFRNIAWDAQAKRLSEDAKGKQELLEYIMSDLENHCKASGAMDYELDLTHNTTRRRSGHNWESMCTETICPHLVGLGFHCRLERRHTSTCRCIAGMDHIVGATPVGCAVTLVIDASSWK